MFVDLTPKERQSLAAQNRFSLVHSIVFSFEQEEELMFLSFLPPCVPFPQKKLSDLIRQLERIYLIQSWKS